jgi:hypothetical protein
MLNIKITADVSSVMVRLAKFRKVIPDAAQDALVESAEAILIPSIKSRLKENRSVFTSELYNKIAVKPRPIAPGKNPIIEVGAFGVPYAERVEKGGPPHTPNLMVILEYVHRKMGLQGTQASMVALAIIKTIEEVGTKPHPFLMPTFLFHKQRFEQDAVRRFYTKLREFGTGE